MSEWTCALRSVHSPRLPRCGRVIFRFEVMSADCSVTVNGNTSPRGKDVFSSTLDVMFDR